jgi:hypothetical protein
VGVRKLPSLNPSPNLDVETGQVAVTTSPSIISKT